MIGGVPAGVPTMGGGPVGLVAARPLKEGDWECAEAGCGNINFSKRTKCNRCGAAKPKNEGGSGGVGAGFPPGLFKQGDWTCTHCSNINWARREKCNICNTSKPMEKSEPRLGRGGGHFDLQDPADRRHHQSDDEDYDEFGRKKKRKSRGPSNGMSTGNSMRHNAIAQMVATVRNSNVGGNLISVPTSSYAPTTRCVSLPNTETSKERIEIDAKMAYPPAPRGRSASASSGSSSSSGSSRGRSRSRSGSLRGDRTSKPDNYKRERDQERGRSNRG